MEQSAICGYMCLAEKYRCGVSAVYLHIFSKLMVSCSTLVCVSFCHIVVVMYLFRCSCLWNCYSRVNTIQVLNTRR